MGKTLKICSYNVGLWNNGSDAGVRGEEIAPRTAAWQRFLDDFSPDFLFCEETIPCFDAAGTLPAYEYLLRSRYPYRWQPDDPAAGGLTRMLMIAGKTPVDAPAVRSFASGSGRPYVAFTLPFDGKTISVFVVHLSIEAHSEGIRQKDLAELAKTLASVEYGVITGDFNTYDIAEFDRHFSGFPMANHGAFGDFETWPHQSSVGNWCRCIDNIITTPNIRIGDVRLGTEVLSDHMPLMAALTLK